MNERLFYCDTNILRFLIDNPSKWPAFQRRLYDLDAVIALSWIQIIELSRVPHYHRGVSRLLLNNRSALLKWWKDLLTEEVERFPETTLVDPLQRPLISDYLKGQVGEFLLQALFSTYQVDIMSEVIDGSKEQYMRVMSWLSTTAPEPTADKEIDFKLHNFGFVLSELRSVNEPFVTSYAKRVEDLKVEAFRGSYMRAAYTYYRYIQDGISPIASDIGDMYQVFYMPYCKNVVLEKSMSGILHRLRKDKNLLPKTEIKSIRYVRELEDS
jgi:hypothetical protein